MHKIKLISIILIFITIFSTLFSFSVLYAADDDEDKTVDINGQEITERLHALQTENPFEMAMSDIALTFGDSVLDYIVFIVKDELTIDRLVFNKIPSLNANFFEANKKGIVPDRTRILCEVINEWYAFFNGLAIVIYLIVLVLVGIKILLRNCSVKSKIL